MVDSFVTGGDICLLTGVSVYGFAILVPAASVGIVPMNSWGDRVHTLPVTAFPGHRVHSIVREIKGDGLLPLGEVWNDAEIDCGIYGIRHRLCQIYDSPQRKTMKDTARSKRGQIKCTNETTCTI